MVVFVFAVVAFAFAWMAMDNCPILSGGCIVIHIRSDHLYAVMADCGLSLSHLSTHVEEVEAVTPQRAPVANQVDGYAVPRWQKQ